MGPDMHGSRHKFIIIVTDGKTIIPFKVIQIRSETNVQPAKLFKEVASYIMKTGTWIGIIYEHLQ
jgi:spore maturation protein SpmA